MHRLPRPYPSSCFTGLGNGLGYLLPRLRRCIFASEMPFMAAGCILERDAEKQEPAWVKLRRLTVRFRTARGSGFVNWSYS